MTCPKKSATFVHEAIKLYSKNSLFHVMLSARSRNVVRGVRKAGEYKCSPSDLMADWCLIISIEMGVSCFGDEL